MKSRLVIIMAMVCLTAGIWALPACGDESPADQQKSYYLKCINNEIENYSCKVVLTTSRSKNLQAYGETAALRTAFLSKNRDALVQEMVAQKVSLRPQAVQQYLRQRFNQKVISDCATSGFTGHTARKRVLAFDRMTADQRNQLQSFIYSFAY